MKTLNYRSKNKMQIDIISKSIVIGVVLGMLAVYTFTGAYDFNADQVEINTYCEMVDIHNHTNGDYGHPDYKNQYKKVCKK